MVLPCRTKHGRPPAEASAGFFRSLHPPPPLSGKRKRLHSKHHDRKFHFCHGLRNFPDDYQPEHACPPSSHSHGANEKQKILQAPAAAVPPRHAGERPVHPVALRPGGYRRVSDRPHGIRPRIPVPSTALLPRSRRLVRHHHAGHASETVLGKTEKQYPADVHHDLPHPLPGAKRAVGRESVRPPSPRRVFI